jgi:hypothetical protein
MDWKKMPGLVPEQIEESLRRKLEFILEEKGPHRRSNAMDPSSSKRSHSPIREYPLNLR